MSSLYHFRPNAVVIDVETTGLKPDRHQLLEIGAIHVRESWSDSHAFHRRVKPSGDVVGHPVALCMHAKSGLLQPTGSRRWPGANRSRWSGRTCGVWTSHSC